jgi:prepilin-type N-terminal cleavage/methylation domain-containing protein
MYGRPARVRESLGFSLIETLVAMSLVGITFIALYAGITSCLFSIRMAREDTRASQILVEKMEAIRTYSWDQINSNGFIPKTFTLPYYSGNSSNGNSLLYEGIVSIKEVPFATNYTNQIKEIKVTLNWKTRELPRTRELSSYVARYGLQRYVFNEE